MNLDDDDRQDLADLMQRIDLMNAKQRRIIGGVVAMLQAFDDDGVCAAVARSTSTIHPRWVEARAAGYA